MNSSCPHNSTPDRAQDVDLNDIVLQRFYISVEVLYC